jgi:GNAT superfamily N-acetyltransferase
VAAARHLLLERIEAVTLEFTVALWRAVADAGFDIKVEEDGELAMAGSAELPSATFNRALGHRTLPNLTDRMLAFYRDAGVGGWIAAERPPWPGAVGEEPIIVFAAEPAEVAAAGAKASALDSSVTIREIERNEAELWSGAFVRASAMDGREGDAWIAMTERLVPAPGYHYLVAEEAGRPIAVGRMYTRRRVGLLATGTVDPSARGRGLQRALIAARVRIAAERGCTTVAAGALAGGVSAANLVKLGFQPVQEYALYRVPPST